MRRPENESRMKAATPNRSPEPPSPPRAAFGQRRELGTQYRGLAAADHCGGAGVGQFNQQLIDTLASLLDQLTLRSQSISRAFRASLVLPTARCPRPCARARRSPRTPRTTTSALPIGATEPENGP